jgi:hypothetical protein
MFWQEFSYIVCFTVDDDLSGQMVRHGEYPTTFLGAMFSDFFTIESSHDRLLSVFECQMRLRRYENGRMMNLTKDGVPPDQTEKDGGGPGGSMLNGRLCIRHSQSHHRFSIRLSTS